jgi:hypothetical protein
MRSLEFVPQRNSDESILECFERRRSVSRLVFRLALGCLYFLPGAMSAKAQDIMARLVRPAPQRPLTVNSFRRRYCRSVARSRKMPRIPRRTGRLKSYRPKDPGSFHVTSLCLILNYPECAESDLIHILQNTREWLAIRVVVITSSNRPRFASQVAECGAFLARRSRWEDDLFEILVKVRWELPDGQCFQSQLRTQLSAQSLAFAEK